VSEHDMTVRATITHKETTWCTVTHFCLQNTLIVKYNVCLQAPEKWMYFFYSGDVKFCPFIEQDVHITLRLEPIMNQFNPFHPSEYTF